MLTEEQIRSELKPTMEVRRYLSSALNEMRGDETRGAELALVRVRLLTEAWKQDRDHGVQGQASHTAHSGASIRQTLRSCFFSQGLYFQLFDKLCHKNLVDNELKSNVSELARDILNPAERGANNRSFFFAIGHALASKWFSDVQEAATWTAYAEAVWEDWYGPGDCYEPGYVAHNIKPIIELGLILGKTEELRSEKALAAFRRYRDHISPSGLAIQPGDGGTQSAYVDALSLMAEITGDGTFLWAAQQAFLAGEYGGYYNANSGRIPKEETVSALERKFAKFKAIGIEPVLPPSAGQVQTMYPETYKIPDRLILNPSRVEDKPFAAFYLNDRMETLHHGHEDNRGDLYHYEVNGVMYIKRSGWQKWVGQSNSLVVDDALSEFPFCYTKGLLSNHWYKASSSLRMLRDFNPSERYIQLYSTPDTFRHTGETVVGDETMMPLPHFFLDKESPYGVHLGNPEGMAGDNELLTVRTVTLSFHTFLRGGKHEFPKSMQWYRDYREVAPADGPVELLIKNIHLGGSKGKLVLIEPEALMKQLEVTLYEDGKKGTSEEKKVLNEDEMLKWVSVVTDELTGERVLKIVSPPGRLDLTWKGLHETVHLTDEYHRIGYDYLYISDVRDYLRTPIRVFVNGMTCRSLYSDHQQGGILKSAVTTKQGEDSFGSMEYEGVYTHDSCWTRQTLLTEEGVLLVVDRLVPGKEAEGLAGGPVWQINRPDEQGLFWFDSVADAELGKSLMVYFHPQRGHEFGVQFQPKLWHDKSYAIYDKTVLVAGREETFVSVLVPHEADVSGISVAGKKHFHSLIVDPREESKGIATEVLSDGTVNIKLQPTDEWQPTPLHVRIQKNGDWQVTRNQ
ncbi:hypothetical protein [Paenibacillus sp. RC67]|uniref:hypothetical protein n=1 Tax=Paenibacillus sp. RC67 TaxID=3039392 RepID=UPI0024ACF1A0|nr:hypothetical protein [Paenibacillus sp. RC67]